MADKQTVAVLGAGGIMGFAMARNLARDGYAIRAFNRSREKAEPLTEDGAEVFDTPAQAAEGAEVIITMVADADAVHGRHGRRQRGAVGLPRIGDAIWLQMSTIGIEGTERCAALAGERGLAFLDAPVLGTKAPAEQGKLVVLASGPERPARARTAALRRRRRPDHVDRRGRRRVEAQARRQRVDPHRAGGDRGDAGVRRGPRP